MEIRIYDDVDLYEYLHDYERNSWGGAYDRLKSLDNRGLLDDFINELQYEVESEMSKVQLNDLIWFECDDIIESLENENTEEEEEED